MLAGGALLIVAAVLTGEAVPSGIALRPLLAVSYLVVFGSWIGFSAYLYLLRRVRPVLATSYAYVNPVIAMFLGVAFAGEHIEATEWLAMPVILSGVALVVAGHARSVARDRHSAAAVQHDASR
jgi:drug/metabolite transporter (DMT)-like permease